MKITLVLKHPRKNIIPREKHLEKHELPAKVLPICTLTKMRTQFHLQQHSTPPPGHTASQSQQSHLPGAIFSGLSCQGEILSEPEIAISLFNTTTNIGVI
jgi:hypothetical protein